MLKNVKIGSRLGLGFGILLVLMAVMAYVAYWGSSELARMGLAVLRVDEPLVATTSDIVVQTLELRRAEKDVFLNAGASEEVAAYDGKWRDARQKVEQDLVALERLMRQQEDGTGDKDLDAVRSFRADLAEYEGGFTKVAAGVRDGTLKDPAAANALMVPFKPAIRRLEKTATDMETVHREQMQVREKEFTDGERRILTLLVSAVLFAGALSVLVGVVITRGVTVPLARTVELARRIAQGDLTERVEADRKDELGLLMGAMKDMTESLGRVISEVRSGATALASASAQVSSTSQSLSQGTSEQAASRRGDDLEPRADERLDHPERGEQPADGADGGQGREGRGGERPDGGRDGGGDEGHRGEGLDHRGDRLPDEPARAERGHRGGARRRARQGLRGGGHRGAQAGRAEPGGGQGDQRPGRLAASQVAERSGRLLEELVPAIRKTADLVQEVAAASNEQASGVAQINKAMSQVDQVTQRNASAAEELASTAEEMASQAEALKQLMAFFRLNGFDERHAPSAAAHAPARFAAHVASVTPAAAHVVHRAAVAHGPRRRLQAVLRKGGGCGRAQRRRRAGPVPRALHRRRRSTRSGSSA